MIKKVEATFKKAITRNWMELGKDLSTLSKSLNST